MTTQTKQASKGRAAKPKTIHLPQTAGEKNRVADLMAGVTPEDDELDLSVVTKGTAEDKALMEAAVAGLTVPQAAAAPRQPAIPMSMAAEPEAIAESVEQMAVGTIWRVPVQMVADSPFNARVWYDIEEVDVVVNSLTKNGQDVPVAGFVEDGKVIVIDGSKRLRAARHAGLPYIRAEIKAKPSSLKDLYLTSRRMNMERSPQTPFDDAVRFKALLEAGEYPDQSSLGAAVGMSQPAVSATLSLNKIPASVMRVMREERNKNNEQKLCQLNFGVELARLFDGTGTEGKNTEELAIDVAREIVAKDLSVKQARDLVSSRLQGKKNRATAETDSVKYAGGAGTLKVFQEKGQIDLSIKDVSRERVEELRQKLRALLAE